MFFYLWCSVAQKAALSLTVIINECMSVPDITWICVSLKCLNQLNRKTTRLSGCVDDVAQ